ncbi:MAG: aminodeoxychorismate/anthranilate synthase component II [Neisseriaceae bacterium]
MLLLIDNYDSFTYNIMQCFAELGQEVLVRRNDQVDCSTIRALRPQYLVIGSGPCTPKEAGVSIEAICTFAGVIPILGICLGHQSIAEAFGGRTVPAKQLMHGRNSPIQHENQGIFRSIPNPVSCTRYHSLVTDGQSLPDCLEITAWTSDRDVMAIRHKQFPIEGVQFHPEAFMSEYGSQMFRNFLS